MTDLGLRGSMCFDWLHHCPMGVQGWGLWSLVGWMLGGITGPIP